ncbi:MAG: ribonuclease HI family protein [Dehalococcoidales bacterium]|nr:ribonuclease HI family protein [Dehalococcoidales bacterium]
MKVIIHADGASRGNPGQSAIGATIKDTEGRLLAAVSQRIGLATNNQAEYRAVIAALEQALKLGAASAEVYLDSELVVKQLKGSYRVKNAALKPLHDRAVGLAGALQGFRVSHLPRCRNAEADALANRAFSG